jgi:hypothetical protein
METRTSVRRNTSGWPEVVCCLLVSFCFFGCNERARLLHSFDRLEREALRYGTVSVGAVRVTDYNDRHLEDAREQLRTALTNLRIELGGRGCKQPTPRTLSEAAGILNPASEPSDGSGKPLEAIKGQLPQLSEIELVGLRMAALKFVESELEDVNLCRIARVQDGFRRVEISLDCSAWVRGDARASLVYIDLYPYNVDCWCHKATQMLEDWWRDVKEAEANNADLSLRQRECHQNKWEALIDKELADGRSGNAFEALHERKKEMPDRSEIDDQRDPEDWVAFCHRWLEAQQLFPHIVHVERMGKAEYLILAESDHSLSKFEIGAAYPPFVSGKLADETGKRAARRMTSVQPLSLAFVAGDRRAGWLFMPSQTGAGRMPPTERRLRMVVDVPERLSKLAIHVHKLFLGRNLEVLAGAAFSRQVESLDQARRMLTQADVLFEDEKTLPRHYRLIKTRMRNLLYQGWAEEIPVDMRAR